MLLRLGWGMVRLRAEGGMVLCSAGYTIMWMGKHGFQLKGVGLLPLGREHDVQLTTLAGGATAKSERELVATGA